MRTLILWIAQGFGVGRIPLAPGTFGSLVGLVWFALLVATGNIWMYAAGTLLGIALSIWLCGEAELILKQTDPASVVLDEIIALPICFAGWAVVRWYKTGALPGPEFFFSAQKWIYTAGIFAAFRFFDIAKPWPIHPIQHLPGGWGVTIDDVLAAVFVALLSLLVVR
jgi:phosphatidylglycerophosphatase A